MSAKAGFRFGPDRIEVEAGTEVVLTLKNAGRLSHNLHLPALGVKTKTIAPS